MPVFICHSVKDEASYSALCLAIDRSGISRWDPAELVVGESLATQLQQTINSCECCIFLATASSLKSRWCLAELGAFWGSGKKVLVYLADSSVTASDLPPQFQGNLSTADAKRLLEAVERAIDSATTSRIEVGRLYLRYVATAHPPMHTEIGVRCEDPDTSTHTALQGKLLGHQERALLYGPYESLPLAGPWRAVFRLKALSEADIAPSEEIVRLDVFGMRGRGVIAEKTLERSELATTYQTYRLDFEYSDLNEILEYRVFLKREAVEVYCDLVTLLWVGQEPG